MLSKKNIDIIEEYLYIYPNFDRKIEEIREESERVTSSDINSYIKSKGKINRSVEYQAILELIIEEKINYCLKWKKLIDSIMEVFKESYPEIYVYINLKYQRKYSITKIQMKTCLTRSTQSRIKKEILYYIAIFAYKENLIKMEEIEDEMVGK